MHDLDPRAAEAAQAAVRAYGHAHIIGRDVQPTRAALDMATAAVKAAAPFQEAAALRRIEHRLRAKAETDSAARPGFRRGLLAAADILGHCADELDPAGTCSCPSGWVSYSEVGPHPSPDCPQHGGVEL